MKKNRIFKVLSSVKLAVPLLLTLAITVGYGTIVESRYNADYARLLVYQTDWFYALLSLLWINIFCATLSRIPFKHHHIGFVITHIGLLTLLAGAFVTRFYGIDGILTIEEGHQGRQVVLPDLVLEVSNLSGDWVKRIPIKKNSSQRGRSSFAGENSRLPKGLAIKKFIPFAQQRTDYTTAQSGEIAVKFGLKSIFFNIQEWLHAKDQPLLKMGPATIELVDVGQKKMESSASKISEASLEVISESSAKQLFRISLEELKKKRTFEVDGVTITLKKIYEQALVDKKTLKEGGQKAKNPALELQLTKGKTQKHEVAFALFPEFSVNTEAPFGFRFKYVSPDRSESKEPTTQQGNLISFQYARDSSDVVEVSLQKDRKTLITQKIKKGEKLFTPWMGIELTLLDLIPKSQKSELVEEVALKERAPLPPSAILIGSSENEDQNMWLLEDEPKAVNIDGQDFNLYFGRQTTILPYAINLVKFKKTNYPGTQTPLSFESQVSLGDQKDLINISMNEPLKNSGFTLYQSSFMELPDGAMASVFSVNKDPGRPIKYLGSVILAIGIVTFTIMRSPRYKKWRANK